MEVGQLNVYHLKAVFLQEMLYGFLLGFVFKNEKKRFVGPEGEDLNSEILEIQLVVLDPFYFIKGYFDSQLLGDIYNGYKLEVLVEVVQYHYSLKVFKQLVQLTPKYLAGTQLKLLLGLLDFLVDYCLHQLLQLPVLLNIVDLV